MDTESLLDNLCRLANTTNRLRFIYNALHYKPECHTYVYDNYRYMNLNLYLDFEQPRTVMFTAHHDIVNMNSRNCLDNNCSVVNLIQLYNKFATNKKDSKYNILISFIDGEETVNEYKIGVKYVIEKYAKKNIEQHIDLELTAEGDFIIMDKFGDFNLLDNVWHEVVDMPYNTARIAHDWFKHYTSPYYIGSACVSLANSGDIKQLKTHKYCDKWRLCHSIKDDFDNVNIEHMDKLVNRLYGIV